MSATLVDAIASEVFRLRRKRGALGALALVVAAGFFGSVAPRIAEKASAVATQLGGPGGAAAASNGFVYLASGLKGVAILTALFLVLAAAGSIAGEAAGGTLRLALCRPVRRGHVFLSKMLVLGAWMEVLLLAGAAAACAGAALVGDFGDVAKFGLVRSSFGLMVGRTVFALALCEAALLAVLGLALLASTWSSSALGALGGTLGCLVTAALAAFALEVARPYLFPAYATAPFETLRMHALAIDAPRPVWFGIPTLQEWADVTFAVTLPLASALLLHFVAAARFVRRDWTA